MKRGCGCLVAFPILVFGLVFTAIGGGWLYSSVQRVNRSTETTGVIVDLNPDFDSDGTTYAPVIESSPPMARRIASPPISIGAPHPPWELRSECSTTLTTRQTPARTRRASCGSSLDLPDCWAVRVGARDLDSRQTRSHTRPGSVAQAGHTQGRRAGWPSSEEDVSVPADTQEDSTESFMTQFRRVEPQGPDTEGKFRYRVVARDDAGALYFSDWLEEDPTTALITSGGTRCGWHGGMTTSKSSIFLSEPATDLTHLALRSTGVTFLAVWGVGGPPI